MTMTIIPTDITVMSATVPTTIGATTIMTIGRIAIGIGGGGIITTTATMTIGRTTGATTDLPLLDDGRPDVIRGLLHPPMR